MERGGQGREREGDPKGFQASSLASRALRPGLPLSLPPEGSFRKERTYRPRGDVTQPASVLTGMMDTPHPPSPHSECSVCVTTKAHNVYSVPTHGDRICTTNQGGAHITLNTAFNTALSHACTTSVGYTNQHRKLCPCTSMSVHIETIYRPEYTIHSTHT